MHNYIMKTKRQKPSGTKKTSRSFDEVVGADTYAIWVLMLQALVPHGCTHRLAVILAGMLQYAASVVAPDRKNDEGDSSLASSLIQATEVGDPSEVEDLIHDA